MDHEIAKFLFPMSVRDCSLSAMRASLASILPFCAYLGHGGWMGCLQAIVTRQLCGCPRCCPREPRSSLLSQVEAGLCCWATP
ncbi:hypothetical protein VTK26DRAFT_5129 [Humicola hyalothermophila]